MIVNDIVAYVESIPISQGRRIVAIAGAPASGKSALSQALADRIQNACVVPMDGFHRSNEDLDAHGLRSVKGAPQTFDVDGFIQLAEIITKQPSFTFPTFDRSTDSVVPDGGSVDASIQTILVEGNYLLLDVSPWDKLAAYWSATIMLDVPISTLRERLIMRWLDHGYDAEGALIRAQGNDIPNAEFVVAHSRPADLMVRDLALRSPA